MKATLIRSGRFSCGHKYENPKWSEQENKQEFGLCYSKHGHGHNYKLDVAVRSKVNPETGMSINLSIVDQYIQQITSLLDHKFLNTDLDYFKKNIPTTENIAIFIYHKLQPLFESQNAELKKVTVFENDDLWVEYE